MSTDLDPRIDVVATGEPGSLSTDQVAALDRLAPGRALFAEATQASGDPREPDEEWTLRNGRPYRDPKAAGRAAVYYGGGRTSMARPMIFADGFNHGPSDMPDLWGHFNEERFLERLIDAGIDVVLLGFDQRHTYIQDNAGVMINCIRRTIAERRGDSPLIVGGVSMGGIIARYALAAMEYESQDHQTATYLSYDSPHNGAWIPLILQQLAYFFEDMPSPPDKTKPAALIRSPAAQQLLWGWVPNAKDPGPVATASPLRQEFLDDLRKVGWFPARPRCLGVANGTADGVGIPVQPSERVFGIDIPGLIGAEALTQADRGQYEYVGKMHFLGSSRESFTTAVAPFDGAPGGTLGSYAQIADALDIDIEDRFRATCFVPSVSAIALADDPIEWPAELHTPVADLPPDKSLLDEFACNPENSEHGRVTPVLADWMVARLT